MRFVRNRVVLANLRLALGLITLISPPQKTTCAWYFGSRTKKVNGIRRDAGSSKTNEGEQKLIKAR